MKGFLFRLFSLTLFCMLVFGHHLNGEHHDEEQEADHHSNNTMAFLKIIPYNFKFTYKFYSHLAVKYPKDNLFFCPISISAAFSMLCLGAKSQTLSQIQEGLGFNISAISTEDIHKGFQQLLRIFNAPNEDLQLSSANALFVGKETHLLPQFLDDAKHFYDSEAIATDFQKSEEAKNQINSYVEKKTRGHIKDLLDSVEPMTKLMLLNTIYFSGKWEKAFNETFTVEKDFHVDEKTVVKVPMMTRRGKYLMAHVPEIGHVIDVPYKGNVSAIFILPEEGKMHDVEEALQTVSLQTWTKLMMPTNVHLSIPKFSLSADVDLKKEFSEMGVTDIFDNNADLSGITGSPLMVSKAIHKSVLHMDEKGTEAAAATAIGVVKVSLPLYHQIEVNRPFILTLLHKTLHTPLFTGRIMNPKL